METIDKQIKEAAIALGHALAKQMIKTHHGGYWDTLVFKNEFKWVAEEDIYNGNAGVLLFFTELYKIKPLPLFRNTIKHSVYWLLHRIETVPSTSASFYSGRTGVFYSLLKANELIGVRGLMLVVTKHLKILGRETTEKDDLLAGKAGVILGLLKIYELMPRGYILKHLNKLIQELLNRLQCGKEGVYWERSPRNIRGLCGFSHGVSGIAHVLFLLSEFTGNTTFDWLAEQALAYENSFYDPQHNNWPDFRRGISPDQFPEYRKAFQKDDEVFFTRPTFMNAWCHGAAGIGHSRLMALKHTKKILYKEDLEKCLKATVIDFKKYAIDNGSFSLCHGVCGNAILFLENFLQNGRKKHLDYCKQIAIKAIESKWKKGIYPGGYHDIRDKELPSLFLGSAGVGYYFLQCIKPQAVPSLLNPKINVKISKKTSSAFWYLRISLPKMKFITLQKRYPETISALTIGELTALKKIFLIGENDDLERRFQDWIWNNTRSLVHEKLQLDILVNNTDVSSISDCYYFIKQDVEKERALANCDQKDWASLQLRLNTNILFINSSNNILLQPPSLSQLQEEYQLLRQNYSGVEKIGLNSIETIIFSRFLHPNSIENAMKEAIGLCAEIVDEPTDVLRNFINGFILDAYKATLLSEPSPIKYLLEN